MPGRDQTGPEGMGAMTGRGGGYCASYDMPGGGPPGFGRGFGRGRGRRNWFRPVGPPVWSVPLPTPEQETADLKTQAGWLKQQLEAISKRIEELEEKK